MVKVNNLPHTTQASTSGLVHGTSFRVNCQLDSFKSRFILLQVFCLKIKIKIC